LPAPRGYLVTFGNASGPVPAIEPLLLSQKGSIFLTRPTLDGLYRHPRGTGTFGQCADRRRREAASRQDPRRKHTYPLKDAAQRRRPISKARKTTGSVVLLP
jgi:NADPH2:quinone reductase